MTENECCPESFQHKIQDVPNTKYHSNLHYLVESEWTGIDSGIYFKYLFIKNSNHLFFVLLQLRFCLQITLDFWVDFK